MDLIWKFTVLNLNFFRECIFLAIFLMYMLDCRCTQCWRESARGRESWNCLLVYTIHMQGIPIWCWSYLLGFYSLHLLYMCTFLHFVCIVSVFSSLFAYLLVFASMFVLKLHLWKQVWSWSWQSYHVNACEDLVISGCHFLGFPCKTYGVLWCSF